MVTQTAILDQEKEQSQAVVDVVRMLSQRNPEGLELHPCCLFSEALMDYDHMKVTLTSNLEFSRRLGP